MKTTMKAQVIRKYGGAEMLHIEEVPVPQPRPDEILVRVAAASFNPIDSAVRAGELQKVTRIDPYLIPGVDFAGVVVKAGREANSFREGQRVFGSNEPAVGGAMAEYTVCKAAYAAEAPQRIPLIHSAAVPLAGLTAWQALFEHAGVRSGKRVLITGAAGGVGTFAIQIAKSAGAWAAGTASAASFAMLRPFGIDQLIDYRSQTIEAEIQEPLDIIVNLAPLPAAAVTRLLERLRRGGVLVSTVAPADPERAQALGVKAISMHTRRDGRILTGIAGLIDRGDVRPVITDSVTLEQLPRVHAASDAGKTRGKIIVTISDWI